MLRQRQFVEDPLCVDPHRYLWSADSLPRSYVIPSYVIPRKETEQERGADKFTEWSLRLPFPLLRDLVLPHLNPSLFEVLLLLSS